jgi:hypothetical protein
MIDRLASSADYLSSAAVPIRADASRGCRRDLAAVAQRPGITEFNGMAVPILALRCRVHGGNPNMRHVESRHQ